jgi:hypothetical protein
LSAADTGAFMDARAGFWAAAGWADARARTAGRRTPPSTAEDESSMAIALAV